MSERENIRLTERTVIKSGPPALMRVEVEKTRRAGAIGRASGLFRVPEVLDLDEARGVAVFERMAGIEPIHDAVPWGREFVDVGERVGRALAAVHRDLALPADMVRPLPPELAFPGQDVFLHGDPSVRNVFLERRSGSLVILDWQMTGLHGGEATRGCRFFDVIWFVNNLLWVPTKGHFLGDPVGPVARRFIAAYYRGAGIPCPVADMAGYAERFFAMKLPLRPRETWRQRLFIPRAKTLTRRFIRSLREGAFDDASQAA